MSYKPTLEDVVRKLLNNATFYSGATKLRCKDTCVDGEEIEEQLRAALHESDLKAMYEESSTNT